MTTAYITHKSSKQHQMSAGHPECPERLWAINDALISRRLLELLIPYDAKKVTRAQILAAHSKNHVDYIYSIAPGKEDPMVPIETDTWMNAFTINAAEYAAGAVCLAVDKVMQGKVKNAFCAVRPPGHHAERNRSMGFCIFNNIAIACYHALNTYPLTRIAIVDFDVHHGNGTEHIFQNDKRVLLCSSFQHPLYPYIAGDNQINHLINIPLAANCSRKEFRQKIEDICLPALHQFKPELLFISAGFDAHAADPLASLSLHEEDFGWITEKLVEIANTHCNGRIISSLEGGYDLNALGSSVAAHINGLIGN